jgi:hypothetical protein
VRLLSVTGVMRPGAQGLPRAVYVERYRRMEMIGRLATFLDGQMLPLGVRVQATRPPIDSCRSVS